MTANCSEAAPWTAVCEVSDVPSNGLRMLSPPAVPREILIANVQGAFFAVSGVCSHRQLPLSEAELVGDTIRCSWHGGMFSVRTGAVRSLPPSVPLETFPVKVERELVWVRIGDGGAAT